MTFFHFPELDCLFIRVRKTGSTSILRGPLEGADCRASRHDPPKTGAALTFAFVRHPIDRLRSAWAMFQSYPREPGDWPANEPLTPERMLEIAADRRIDPAGATFVEKLRLHVLPMSDRHYRLDRADFLGRFESLGDDWRRLAHRLGLEPAPLPHWRRTDPARLPELSPTALGLAREVYRDDFEAFGYAAPK